MLIARRLGLASGALFVALLAVPTHAETVLGGFVGTTFGGGAEDDFGDDSHLVYGGALSMLGGPIGFEIDGQYSPKFFGGAPDSNVASLMGALTIGGGQNGFHVYGALGAGLLRSRVRDVEGFFDTDRNIFGITVGGSVVAPLGSKLALKGDVRYFRALSNVDPETVDDIDLGGFHFWRATAGLGIRL